jgi:hypothetical protein
MSPLAFGQIVAYLLFPWLCWAAPASARRSKEVEELEGEKG